MGRIQDQEPLRVRSANPLWLGAATRKDAEAAALGTIIHDQMSRHDRAAAVARTRRVEAPARGQGRHHVVPIVRSIGFSSHRRFGPTGRGGLLPRSGLFHSPSRWSPTPPVAMAGQGRAFRRCPCSRAHISFQIGHDVCQDRADLPKNHPSALSCASRAASTNASKRGRNLGKVSQQGQRDDRGRPN